MSSISVITVAYNNFEGLKKTIQSVVNQTYTNFEFIVIDGNSNDGTKELLQEYNDQITYWISEPDKGIYNAMNKGIKAAKGDYVIFMNSGDIFHEKNTLEKAVTLFSDAYVIYGNNFKTKGNSKRLKTYEPHLRFSFFYTSSINHQSTFIKRKLFDEVFYYNENFKIASDWELFVVAICKLNYSYQYINLTICEYDFTGISSTEKYRALGKKERLATYEKYFPTFVEDYKDVALLNSKRIQQVIHIQKSPFLWKIFKWTISLFLIWTPKIKK